MNKQETQPESPGDRLKASPRAVHAGGEILARWEQDRDRLPLDRIVQSELRARTYLNAGERRWVSEAVYGSVRYLRRQQYLLNQREQDASPENLLQLWLEQTTEATDFTAVLPGPDQPSAYLRETLAFPDALAMELETLPDEERIAAAEAFNRQASTTLRINTLKATRTQVQSRLPDAVPTQWSPWGLELPRRVNLYEMPGFREGWFELQDEASQLAVLLTDARPGETIIEVGAGAGGKSLALAAMMRNRGIITAFDTVASRFAELDKRAKRAGAKIIHSREIVDDEADGGQLSGENNRNLDSGDGAAHCVFIDAPCTGSGVLRRNPDAKWRNYDTEAFAMRQKNLLTRWHPYVRPGGCLIYVTCAIERSQNEDVIGHFLGSSEGADFRPVSAVERLGAALARFGRTPAGPPSANNDDLDSFASGSFLRTWPHRHGMDAFFAAALERRDTK